MRLPFYLFIIAMVLIGPDATAQTLTIVVKNVKNSKGVIGAAIYKDAAEFMKTALVMKETKSKEGEVQLVFNDLPAGTYAVSVMHDANQNAKLDTNGIGIPKEGFGFSNNAMGVVGPPDFASASIVMGSKDEVIVITLKYF